jgi:hypothetical protein
MIDIPIDCLMTDCGARDVLPDSTGNELRGPARFEFLADIVPNAFVGDVRATTGTLPTRDGSLLSSPINIVAAGTCVAAKLTSDSTASTFQNLGDLGN